jgi:hypothetical protein
MAADLNKAYRIINAALDEFKERLKIVEPRFNQQVLDWIKKFESYNGTVISSERNSERLLKFKRATERFLLQSGYNDMVTNFLVNFDELQDNQKVFQAAFNGITLTDNDKMRTILSDYRQFSIKQVIQGLQKQGLNQRVLQPIEATMYTTVQQGGSLRDLIQSVEGIIDTTEKRAGLLTSNAIQVSRDALGQYNGKVNEAVRKVYKMDGILYVGSLVKDSRPQCERWVNIETFGQVGLIPFADLPREIRWANNNGTGMIPGTTPETFAELRGGYNCRHEAYPTRLDNFRN